MDLQAGDERTKKTIPHGGGNGQKIVFWFCVYHGTTRIAPVFSVQMANKAYEYSSFLLRNCQFVLTVMKVTGISYRRPGHVWRHHFSESGPA